MDYGALVSEAVKYTKEALVGNWVTWLIFILCSLPIALINFVFDPKKIFTGTTIHWELIPWTQVIALFVAGLLLSFIVSGYLVRVYRGITPPPKFDSWCSLYLDGIKIAIVGFVWFVPALVIVVIAVALMLAGALGGASMGTMVDAGLIVLLIGLIVFVITSLYAALGCVRFARTGSIREGLRFSAITGTIRAIGWGAYILALVIMLVLVILISLIIALLALIPYAGWVIQLVLTPIISVFTARYISRVYDHSVPQAPAPAPAPVTP
jgi:hypothetical protein